MVSYTLPNPAEGTEEKSILPQNFGGTLNYSQRRIWGEAFDHLDAAVAQLALDGTVLTANNRLCEVIGSQTKELIGRKFHDFLEPEERDSKCETIIRRLVAGQMDRYSTRMNVRRTDGEIVRLEMAFLLVRDKTTNITRCLTVIAHDITFLRKISQQLQDSELARVQLSRRMMDAQEAERTRISRELHHDIGQSLAILKIDMVRAKQQVSDHPEKMQSDLEGFAGRLDAIIHKVNCLAHNLHSSTLEFLGLAIAVKRHCRECSEQLRLPIQCHCDIVEKEPDRVIALAFLRIVQEAIHNAIKHSRATNMVVRLNGTDRYLGLEVSDDGVGFDIEVTKFSAGLGLISMRERIHLIGGEFNIFSSPGRGTRIVARAPITQNKILEPFFLKSRSSDRARQEGPR
jgi:PAS domain S-box-containing protein